MNAAVYRTVVADLVIQPQTAWVIGNLPRSDTNPTLAAGLNAVFVPHDNALTLEQEEVGPVPAEAHLLVLERFADLRAQV